MIELLGCLLFLPLVGLIVFEYRKLWYWRRRHEWNGMVSEFNMAMIRKTAEVDVFRLEKVVQSNLPNYFALGEYPHGFYNLLNWKMDALVKDRGCYEMVTKYLDERRAELS